MSERMIKIGSQMVNEADYKAGKKLTPISIEEYEKSLIEKEPTKKKTKSKK